VDGIDEHMNNLQQGVSRSASMTSYTLDVSNASDKRKISMSNESDDPVRRKLNMSMKKVETSS
jgi:hypothetical protein